MAVYPKPRLSHPGEHIVRYPYVLGGLTITRNNHVWSTYITYIRLRGGFLSLVAMIDWFSRSVLAWQTSITLETSFCLEARDQAFQKAHPEIFTTDQGSQCTSHECVNRLRAAEVRIRWGGRGRALGNIFVERLWRSVKYEEVYIKDYRTIGDAERGLKEYFRFYNQDRFHQSLEYRIPAHSFAVWLSSLFMLVDFCLDNGG